MFIQGVLYLLRLYANDAEQRIKDSELLINCGRWLASGGNAVAQNLRASDLTEKNLSKWKKILETDLGVVLPPLTKRGEIRRIRPTNDILVPI